MEIGHDLLGWYLYKDRDDERSYWGGDSWGNKKKRFRTRHLEQQMRNAYTGFIVRPSADLQALRQFDIIKEDLATNNIESRIEFMNGWYQIHMIIRPAGVGEYSSGPYKLEDILGLDADTLRNNLYDYMEKIAYHYQLDHDRMLLLRADMKRCLKTTSTLGSGE